jgi:hypothetical protein
MITTTKTPRGEELATQVNLGEVLNWRLHWLTMRLEKLQKKVEALPLHSNRLNANSDGLTALVDELDTATCEFEQLKQQTMIMLGLDYDNEVQPLLDHVPKYATFCEQLTATKGVLEAKAKQASEADLGFMMERIRSAARYR